LINHHHDSGVQSNEIPGWNLEIPAVRQTDNERLKSVVKPLPNLIYDHVLKLTLSETLDKLYSHFCPRDLEA